MQFELPSSRYNIPRPTSVLSFHGRTDLSPWCSRNKIILQYLVITCLLSSTAIAVSTRVCLRKMQGSNLGSKTGNTDTFRGFPHKYRDLQGIHPVVCINISFLYIRHHTNKIHNSLPHLCQLSLFNLWYSYATCFGSHGAIVRQYNI
jgi:hypothetical protein